MHLHTIDSHVPSSTDVGLFSLSLSFTFLYHCNTHRCTITSNSDFALSTGRNTENCMEMLTENMIEWLGGSVGLSAWGSPAQNGTPQAQTEGQGSINHDHVTRAEWKGGKIWNLILTSKETSQPPRNKSMNKSKYRHRLPFRRLSPVRALFTTHRIINFCSRARRSGVKTARSDAFLKTALSHKDEDVWDDTLSLWPIPSDDSDGISMLHCALQLKRTVSLEHSFNYNGFLCGMQMMLLLIVDLSFHQSEILFTPVTNRFNMHEGRWCTTVQCTKQAPFLGMSLLEEDF